MQLPGIVTRFHEKNGCLNDGIFPWFICSRIKFWGIQSCETQFRGTQFHAFLFRENRPQPEVIFLSHVLKKTVHKFRQLRKCIFPAEASRIRFVHLYPLHCIIIAACIILFFLIFLVHHVVEITRQLFSHQRWEFQVCIYPHPQLSQL